MPRMEGLVYQNTSGKSVNLPTSCHTVKREAAPTPPPSKPAMSEDDVDKKSKAIIEEYLHINDVKVRSLLLLPK